MKASAPNPAIEKAADALRLYEMEGRVTLSWERISAAQKRKWRKKAQVVLDTFFNAA